MRPNRTAHDRGKALAALSGLAALLSQGPAMAGDVKAGRTKADVCEVCHGLDGLSKIAEAPNIAGQNEHYLIEQFGAFQSGARANDMMSRGRQGSLGGRYRESRRLLLRDSVTVGKPRRKGGAAASHEKQSRDCAPEGKPERSPRHEREGRHVSPVVDACIGTACCCPSSWRLCRSWRCSFCSACCADRPGRPRWPA